jgi:hypothetical protein
VKIASHHAWKDNDYVPHHDWPGDTVVQWGSNGVVLGEKSYNTAFFEAFPDEALSSGGFIRGEGKTIVEAENQAFERFKKETACNHLWGREHYTNSGQLCRHCRAFRCKEIKPIVKLGSWRKPVEYYEVWAMDGDNEYSRVLRLRAKVFGISERPDVK